MAVRPATFLLADKEQPLVGLIVDDHGRDVAHYFLETSQGEVKNSSGDESMEAPYTGAWSDLDWESVEDELQRIRHQGEPTPPIDDL